MNSFLTCAAMRILRWTLGLTLGLIAGGFVGFVHAQESSGGIEVLQVRPNFYMIAGAGGNIGVQIGADGVVLVNAGAQEASGQVLAAIRKLTDQPIRYLITTSADPDLVGGNAALSLAGRNIISAPLRGTASRVTVTGADVDAARILAHENVLFRMSASTGKTSPFPSEAWPSESFRDRRKAMYFNDEGIEILHQPAAHTDGDSVVFFRRSDVVVAGNILDTTRFPVIDVAKGGSIQGEIDALNRLLELAIPPGPHIGTPSGASALALQPGGTEVLPGHGRIYRQGDVLNYRDMIVVIRDNVQDLINRKMTLDQIKAAAPAKPYEPQYGSSSGPWTTNDFVEAVYKTLTNPVKNQSQER